MLKRAARKGLRVSKGRSRRRLLGRGVTLVPFRGFVGEDLNCNLVFNIKKSV